MDVKVLSHKIKNLFFGIIVSCILFACYSEDSSEIEVETEIEEEKIDTFYADVTEIKDKDSLLTYCCNKKINRLEPLSLLSISFIDMSGNHNQGQLIVHADLAYEVVEIFKEIYECKFPIERMVTIDHFNCDDDSSMRQNNTSGFNYRLVSGTRKLSDHSYGRAIDINPLFNPFVKRDKVEPANAEAYIDRDNIQAGMIQRDDCVVRAFKNRGWQWGGDWKYAKDYQHFYKY